MKIYCDNNLGTRCKISGTILRFQVNSSIFFKGVFEQEALPCGILRHSSLLVKILGTQNILDIFQDGHIRRQLQRCALFLQHRLPLGVTTILSKMLGKIVLSFHRNEPRQHVRETPNRRKCGKRRGLTWALFGFAQWRLSMPKYVA